MEFAVGHHQQAENMDSVKIWVWVPYFVDRSLQFYALRIFTWYVIVLLLPWK